MSRAAGPLPCSFKVAGYACQLHGGHMGPHKIPYEDGSVATHPSAPNAWHNRDFRKEKQALKNEKPHETILDEAKKLVYGDREAEYNHPAIDFERIATLWRAYFKANGNGVINIGASDVAKLMMLLKLSRLTNSYHHDSVVDIAGYALCLARLEEES